MTTKVINNKTFVTAQIGSLVVLNIDTEYKIVKVYSTLTKYNNYVVSIKDTETLKTFNIYMPDYIVEYAVPGTSFIYNGLRLTKDGHAYHQVLWESNGGYV